MSTRFFRSFPPDVRVPFPCAAQETRRPATLRADRRPHHRARSGRVRVWSRLRRVALAGARRRRAAARPRTAGRRGSARRSPQRVADVLAADSAQPGGAPLLAGGVSGGAGGARTGAASRAVGIADRRLHRMARSRECTANRASDLRVRAARGGRTRGSVRVARRPIRAAPRGHRRRGRKRRQDLAARRELRRDDARQLDALRRISREMVGAGLGGQQHPGQQRTSVSGAGARPAVHRSVRDSLAVVARPMVRQRVLRSARGSPAGRRSPAFPRSPDRGQAVQRCGDQPDAHRAVVRRRPQLRLGHLLEPDHGQGQPGRNRRPGRGAGQPDGGVGPALGVAVRQRAVGVLLPRHRRGRIAAAGRSSGSSRADWSSGATCLLEPPGARTSNGRIRIRIARHRRSVARTGAGP